MAVKFISIALHKEKTSGNQQWLKYYIFQFKKKGKKPREVVLRQEEMRDTGASSLLNSLSGTFQKDKQNITRHSECKPRDS